MLSYDIYQRAELNSYFCFLFLFRFELIKTETANSLGPLIITFTSAKKYEENGFMGKEDPHKITYFLIFY